MGEDRFGRLRLPCGAAQRGLDTRAPFTSDKNSVADALLIEIYFSQISDTDPADVYAFVTSNHRDFSMPNGDHRLPHPDLAELFDGSRSRYAYQVEGLHELLTGSVRAARTALIEQLVKLLDGHLKRLRDLRA